MKKLALLFLTALFAFTGCNKPDLITLNTSEISLYHGETHQIQAESKSAIRYESKNEYHAKVSTSGLITAMCIGETTITLKNEEDSKTFKVTVKPKHNVYPEPKIYIGMSKSYIISMLGPPDDQSNDGKTIFYENYSTAAPLLGLSFDNNNCLEDYMLMVKSAYTSVLPDFFNERYVYAGTNGDIFVWINDLDAKRADLSIALSLYNISYWMVIYFDPNSPKGELSAENANKYIQLIKEIQ